MALKYQKQKNLVRSPDEYTKYYGDFRGVDFSSDHTEVHEQRLAYAINMYKDYRTGEGNAIETVPGFRRRFEAPRYTSPQGEVTLDKINGIHEFEYVKTDGTRDKDILVHAGQYLYLWDTYPLTVNVLLSKTLVIPETGKLFLDIDFECSSVKSVTISGAEFSSDFTLSINKDRLELGDTFLQYRGHSVSVNYYESEKTRAFAPATNGSINSVAINDAESHSVVFNNRLYIIDGAGYYVYYRTSDTSNTFELSKVQKYGNTYLPTIYRNLAVGDISPEDLSKYEYEQKNLLNDKFKHTYIAAAADKDVKEYPLYETNFASLMVTVYGEEYHQLTEGDTAPEKGYELDTTNGKIIFNVAPPSPTSKGKPENYAGIEIIYTKTTEDSTNDVAKINNCTILSTFDKRVFLTGNPAYPNNIWFCGINNSTGYEDATYFGELDVVIDGVENAPITGLIAVADTLTAIKNHAKQDGAVYFHTRMETNSSVIPVTYPSEQGLSGIGCLGACVNFLDDPIFISRLGVEAIGQLSVRLERAVEHRSSLIDAKLVNLDLENARFTEWDGYLVLLVDGKIFLADSRQRYAHDTGVAQYEWYYLEGIGIYEDSVEFPCVNEYYYAPVSFTYIPEKETFTVTVTDLDGNTTTVTKELPTSLATNIYNPEFMTTENRLYTPVRVDEDDFVNTQPQIYHKTYSISDVVNGEELSYYVDAYYVIKRTWDGQSYDGDGNRVLIEKAILCEDYGSKTGGEFYPAKKVINIDENIFFGTNNGIVCSFNFDLKNTDGTISPSHYSFDHRTIYCGIATKMDNCGIPHLTKSTIKKSTVIKTKSMIASAAKVRVRTNNKGYASVARVNSRVFSFDDVDFSDFSFVSTDQTIFAIKEKEKHWVEKQHWIYSDEYQRPFSVHYLAFRYKVSGRIKGSS